MITPSTITPTISTVMTTGLPRTTQATERLHPSTDMVGQQPLRRFLHSGART